MGLLNYINKIPEGYSEEVYNERKYSITKEIFNTGKSFKIFARELQGNDFISLNYYITSKKEFLKPCEMPQEKIIHFLKNIHLLQTQYKAQKLMSKDFEFTNKRFDPSITPFLDLAKQMAVAFGYTADLQTDKKLAQLLRLRVSQKNECSYCVILHAKTSREIGISDAKTDNISSWWNSDLFNEKEKIALQYCDVLTEGTHKNFQEHHNAMTQFFNTIEIAEIAAIIINMNVWTRLKLAQGETPTFK